MSLLDENGVTAFSVETPDTLELRVRAPEPIFVSVEVDRDQNGQFDRLVDIAYRPQRDRSLCTQYLIDATHSTACGQFRSAAYLTDQKNEEGRTEYVLVLPKKELSFDRPSARFSFVMWNSAQRQTTYFPIGRFQNTLTVTYRMNAAAERSTTTAANSPSEPKAVGFGLGSDYHPSDRGTFETPIYHSGGNISNPVIKHAPAPHFSDEAKKAKYQGVVVVGLIVDAQGNPQSVRVVRPLGMGLDEEALKAVRKYKFKPALKDGQTPVPVSINIEVNFRILGENPVSPAPVRVVSNPPEAHGDALDQRLRTIAGDDAEDCGTVPVRADPSAARSCAEKAISQKKSFLVRFRVMSIDSNVSYAFAGSPGGEVFQIEFSDRRLSERECPAPVQLWGVDNEIPDCFLTDMAAACKGKNASASVPPAILDSISQAAKASQFEEVIRIADQPNSGLRVLWLGRGKTGRILSYGIGNQEGCSIFMMQMNDVE